MLYLLSLHLTPPEDFIQGEGGNNGGRKNIVNIYKKFWLLLDRKQKNISIRLIALTVMGAIFEAGGVGLIVPFISVVTAENIVFPEFLLEALPLLNSLNQSETIVLMVGVLFYFIC